MKITEKQNENARCYNTDKFHGANKSIPHYYGDYYDALLEPLQTKQIDVLEIGVQGGGSVRIFHDYLVNARIVGVDIEDTWNYKAKENYPRLSLFYFDAYRSENMAMLPVQQYDIIIDDGPHTIDSQIYFLNSFARYLKSGGRLILEDVPHYNLQAILDAVTCDKSRLTVHRFDLITNHFDDIIIEYKG